MQLEADRCTAASYRCTSALTSDRVLGVARGGDDRPATQKDWIMNWRPSQGVGCEAIGGLGAAICWHEPWGIFSYYFLSSASMAFIQQGPPRKGRFSASRQSDRLEQSDLISTRHASTSGRGGIQPEGHGSQADSHLTAANSSFSSQATLCASATQATSIRAQGTADWSILFPGRVKDSSRSPSRADLAASPSATTSAPLHDGTGQFSRATSLRDRT